MIALEDLSIAIGNFRLDRINLTAGNGEYLMLVGPSGAGKTVLLETIAGIRSPDNGKVTINGNDMAGVPPEHRGVALVYQDYSLFPHLTVAENIAYGMKIQGTSPLQVSRRVDTLLADFKIMVLKDRYPGSLSGGEQQRVALARALATNPSLLLLDEPFASLDPRTRDECIRMMQDLRDTRSVTIIQVSHSRDDAYALADRAAVLIGGMVAQAGSTDEVFRYPASAEVARFVGLENIFSGQVLTSGPGWSRAAIEGGEIRIPGNFPRGTRITVGIPADCVRMNTGDVRPVDPGMNIVDSTVRRVTAGRDTILFQLDGLVPLTSALHRTSDNAEVPPPGKRVIATFRDTDVRILSGD